MLIKDYYSKNKRIISDTSNWFNINKSEIYKEINGPHVRPE